MRRVRWLALSLLLLCAPAIEAQDLVPGAYTPGPKGIYVLTLVTNLNRGKVLFDESLPVEDAKATITGAAISLARTLGIAGRSGNVAVILPAAHGHFSGLLNGEFQDVTRTGPADLGARVAINLYGAPAMTRPQFGKYRVRTLVGTSLTVTFPTGQYDHSRIINVGANRWSIKPEVGLSRRLGHWTIEGDVAGAFFTDNTDFRNGGVHQQAAIAAFQGHLIYTVRPNLWVAGDGNFWHGGRITNNGVDNTGEQRNSRLGLTLAVPIARQQVRIAYSYGAYTRLGGDFKALGVSYSYAWSGRRNSSTP